MAAKRICKPDKGTTLNDMIKGNGHLIGPAGEYDIYTEGQTPCAKECPAGIDIKAYVNLIADRRYEDAVRVIRRANPFPGICGRICTHPCEDECNRKDIDDPISIKNLKRFAADHELSRKERGAPREIIHEEKIAVVGSGPAGLTASSDLAMEGVEVTVYDSSRDPGGLLSWGIPDFRLPKNIVRSEIRDIESIGVKIVTGERVNKPAKLLESCYSAVIMATGCQKPVLPGIPGEDGSGVMDCLEFLKDVSQGKRVRLGDKTIVIGGGNAALDSARTAVRLGADVTIAYRRTEEQMPADHVEIAHAKEEGIDFHFLAIPLEIEPGVSVRFQRAELGEPDGSGRRRPMPIPGDHFRLDADSVILAIGSKVDPSVLPEGMDLTMWGTPVVDDSGMTSVEGVFAAGDLVTGPSTVVDAIGSGHVAAYGVMRYLGKKVTGIPPSEMLIVETPSLREGHRCISSFIPPNKRTSTFDEIDLGITERDAINEALRCRRCGSCDVCDMCLAVCDYRNAVISIPDTGERVLAKVPVDLARSALEKGAGGFEIETKDTTVEITIEPYLARVDRELCISCGRCEEACPYKAIRTIFRQDGTQYADVDISACRGCGACAGACPSGALMMGSMDDMKILASISHELRASEKDVITISCIWEPGKTGLGTLPGEVVVQCTRRTSPALLIAALSMGVKAVVIRGCGEDGCHYLHGPRTGADVVDSCQNILRAADVSPERILYTEDAGTIDHEYKPLAWSTGILSEPKAGLGRCLDAITVLMAQPDVVRDPEGDSTTFLAYGDMGITEPVFRAYGLQDTDLLDIVARLLKAGNVDHALAPGIHNSGTRLKELGMEELYRRYTETMVKRLDSWDCDTLIIPTPECYDDFKNMNFGCQVVSLPGILNGRLRFPEVHETVAYHPSCTDGDAFDEDCLALLGSIPGLRVVRSEGDCGNSGWRDVRANSRDSVKALLDIAEREGARIVVTGSTVCASHIKAVNAGWNTSPVEVMDIYSYLSTLIGGDE